MPLLMPWSRTGVAVLNGSGAPSAPPAVSTGGTPPATGISGQRSAPVLPVTQNATPAPVHQAATNTTAGLRSPTPVQTSILEGQMLRVATDQWTGTSATSGIRQPWQLPATDQVGMVLSIGMSYSSGATVTGSIQPTTAIAYALINDASGRTVMTIPGNLLHELYKRFSPWTTDFAETATTVAASQSNTALPSVAVMCPWFAIPGLANGAQYQIALVYQPISALGSYGTNNSATVTAATGVTGYTITVGVTTYFGNTMGQQAYLTPYSNKVSPGVNDLAQNQAVKNVSINDLLMYNFAADTDLDHIQLSVNTGAQVPYEDEPNLLAAYLGHIQAARASGTFWLFPNSQIAFNATTSFQMFLAAGATTTTVYFLAWRLAPPGS